MGFRKEGEFDKTITEENFSIGSVIVGGGNSDASYLLVKTGEKQIGCVNLNTFVLTLLKVVPDNMYHMTSEEATSAFYEIREFDNICATRSDMGWNSVGLKDVQVQYTDN